MISIDRIEPGTEYQGRDGLQRWRSGSPGHAVRDEAGRVWAVREHHWQAAIVAAAIRRARADGIDLGATP